MHDDFSMLFLAHTITQKLNGGRLVTWNGRIKQGFDLLDTIVLLRSWIIEIENLTGHLIKGQPIQIDAKFKGFKIITGLRIDTWLKEIDTVIAQIADQSTALVASNDVLRGDCA